MAGEKIKLYNCKTMNNENFNQDKTLPSVSEGIKEERIKRMREYIYKIDHPSPEIVKQAWQVKKFQLNKRDIELVGVAHHPDTMKILEYKEKLELAIQNASLVILEGLPKVYNNYSKESIKQLVRSLDLMTDVSDEELDIFLDRNINNNPFLDFFGQLQRIAAKYNKCVAMVDPCENIYQDYLLKSENQRFERIKMITMVLSLAAMAGAVGVEAIYRVLPDKPGREKLATVKNPAISRRTFLKIIGSAAIAAGTISNFSTNASTNQSLGQDRNKNFTATALYNLYDYREAAVAEALDVFSKQNLGQGPIELVYGAFHVAGIKYYAEHPLERKAKLLAYAPFSKSPQEAIKVFSHESDGWKRIEKVR